MKAKNVGNRAREALYRLGLLVWERVEGGMKDCDIRVFIFP